MTAFLNSTGGGPVVGATSAANLRTVTSASFLIEQLAMVTGLGQFRWDPVSAVADDGTTVIKPNDVGGNGRWLAFSGGGAAGVDGLPWVVFRPGVAIVGTNVFDNFETMFDFLDTTEGPQVIFLDLSNSILPAPNAFSVPARSVGQYDFRGEIEMLTTSFAGAGMGILFQQQILNLKRISGPMFLLSDIAAPGNAILQMTAPDQLIIEDGAALTVIPGNTPVVEILTGGTGSAQIILGRGTQLEGSPGDPVLDLTGAAVAPELKMFDDARLRADTVRSIVGTTLDVKRLCAGVEVDLGQVDMLGAMTVADSLAVVSIQTLCNREDEPASGVSTVSWSAPRIVGAFSTPPGWVPKTAEMTALFKMLNGNGQGHARIMDTGKDYAGVGVYGLTLVTGSEVIVTGSSIVPVVSSTGDIFGGAGGLVADRRYVVQAECFLDATNTDVLEILGLELVLT